LSAQSLSRPPHSLKCIAVSFVNYLDELPFFCAEVLPGLARAGLREPSGSAAARVPA
jgi:hypothetical protein